MDRHKKARIALRKSIKHWMLDIVRPLKKGYQIDLLEMTWIHNNEPVKCDADHCALCQEYPHCYSEDFIEDAIDYRLNKDEFTIEQLDSFDYVCPLFLFQKDICGGFNTAWEWFSSTSRLEAAVAMVNDLVKCYNEYV